MKMYTFLPPYTKINCKRIIELHVRTYAIETLEENFGLEKGFLDMTSKSKVTEEKKPCNWSLLNFTMFASKDIIKK